MNWIERSASKTLRDRLKLYPAVTLLGARQVGKSSMVRRFLKENWERSSLFIDLEIEEDRIKLQRREKT